MFNLTLSWDLFIVVFFAIVMSYSFIIGRHESMKVVIACYIGIIATQGIGNVLARMLGNSDVVLAGMGLPVDLTLISLAKVFLFAVCVIAFVARSGIDVAISDRAGTITSIVQTALIGFSTAGLIVSTILTYAAGGGILDSSVIASGTIGMMAQSSTLMQLMILNQDVWFTLPAFLIIVNGLMNGD